MSSTFVSNMPAVTLAIAVGSAGGVQKAAYHVRNSIVLALRNTPKRTGHVYKVPGTNVTYTASAPGEYPATVTGRLRGSFRAKKIGPSSYAVGSDVKYVEPLDKIRPFMKDIFEKESAEMKLIIRGGGTQTRLTDAARWF